MGWSLALTLALALSTSDASTSTDLVRIDVVAADAQGHRVENLLAHDFEIVSDGTPLSIQSVSEAAGDSGRIFAIVLDEYHVSADATASVRDALARFVDRAVGPNDRVLVVQPLDSLVSLRATHDRAAVHQAIASFEGRKGKYAPRNAFERNYFAGDPVHVEAARAQIAVSMLNAATLYIGGLDEGRKTLIFVSEGFQPAPRSRRGDLPTIDGAVRTAERRNVSIYSIDPRSLLVEAGAPSADGPGDPHDDHEVLHTLATETDGAVIVAAADRETGFDRIVHDASGFYMLTVAVDKGLAPGSFYPVQVSVKRPNVRLRARSGFWTPSADDALVASLLEEPAVGKPAGPPLRSSTMIRPWIGTARGANDLMRVIVVWEAAPIVPGAGDRRLPRKPERVHLVATTEGGKVVFDGPLAPSSPLGPKETAAQAAFNVSPGRVRLQMRIEDGDERLLDTDVREVVVGSLPGDVAFGSVSVLRTRTAREFRTIENDVNVPPVAAREFSRAERLLIRAPVYSSGPSPTVSARLLNQRGASMRDLTVTTLPEASADGSPAVRQVDVPLASLAPGDYSIDLVAMTPGGEARQNVAFRVTQ